MYWHRAFVEVLLKKWAEANPRSALHMPGKDTIAVRCTKPHASAFEVARSLLRVDHDSAWRQFKCDVMDSFLDLCEVQLLLNNVPFEAQQHPFGGTTGTEDHFGEILKKTRLLLAPLLDKSHPAPPEVMRISIREIQTSVPERQEGKALLSTLVELANMKSKETPLEKFADFPPDTVLPFYRERVRQIFDDMEKSVSFRMQNFAVCKQTALDMLREYRRTRARDDSQFDMYFDSRMIRATGADISGLGKKAGVVVKKAISKCNSVTDAVLKATNPEHQLFKLPLFKYIEEPADGAHSGCAGL